MRGKREERNEEKEGGGDDGNNNKNKQHNNQTVHCGRGRRMTVAARMTDDNVEGRRVEAPVSTLPATAAAYTSASVIIHPF